MSMSAEGTTTGTASAIGRPGVRDVSACTPALLAVHHSKYCNTATHEYDPNRVLLLSDGDKIGAVIKIEPLDDKPVCGEWEITLEDTRTVGSKWKRRVN